MMYDEKHTPLNEAIDRHGAAAQPPAECGSDAAWEELLEAEVRLHEAVREAAAPEAPALHGRIMRAVATQAAAPTHAAPARPRRDGRSGVALFAMAAVLLVTLAVVLSERDASTLGGLSARATPTVGPSRDAELGPDALELPAWRLPETLERTPLQVAEAGREINATASSVMDTLGSVLRLVEKPEPL